MLSARLRLTALLVIGLGSPCVLGCFAVHSYHGSAPSHPVTLSTPSNPAADALPVYLAQTPEEAKQYVGDSVCASCHTEIGRQYRITGHARSLSLVTLATEGRFFRQPETIRDTKTDTAYHLAVRKGECAQVNDAQGENESLPAQIAVGSMHNGETYLGQDQTRQWFVLRLSYYTHTHGWDFTPGQEPDVASFADPKGQALSLKQVSGCLSCHATSLLMTSDGPDARHSHFGVGCESCHGPGRAHVDSLLKPGAGATRHFAPMEDLKKEGAAARVMRICGGCHSTLSSSLPGLTKTEESVSRFASTALVQSKCFQSSGTLSCVTCHSPHSNVETNIAAYESACLRCHGGPPTAVQQAVDPANRPRFCKVNSRNGCIGCHMPTQDNRSFPHTLFHNHWIKVWQAASTAKS